MRDKIGKQNTKHPILPIKIEKNKLLKLILVTNPLGKNSTSKRGNKGSIIIEIIIAAIEEQMPKNNNCQITI